MCRMQESLPRRDQVPPPMMTTTQPIQNETVVIKMIEEESKTKSTSGYLYYQVFQCEDGIYLFIILEGCDASIAKTFEKSTAV